MTVTNRTAIFLMVFSLYLANNIIVPVHALSHIQEHHEPELASCDIYHAAASIAVISACANSGPTLSFRSINSSLEWVWISVFEPMSKQIRAPPSIT
ncbi:hypothetical protein [Reinekea sp. G2M2-21]|uniref:hypothetical protein n=1 Tax=Reinekea sp. G2M2-21 TaxID=2788942 RepID=UPI0018A8EDDB|nr:hypothetical protein [Reinekea sp. G2M2-21]